jgi:hypothetical protein
MNWVKMRKGGAGEGRRGGGAMRAEELLLL